MALTDPSGDIDAQLTNKAREMIARATLGEVAFRVIGFGLGRGGYDPVDPVQILAIDPSNLELDDKCFPDSDPFTFEPFTSTEEPEAMVRVYNCRVQADPVPGNADFGLGELGLYAEILKSNLVGEVGEKFLYAICHFPIMCKTRRDTFLRRVVVSY